MNTRYHLLVILLVLFTSLKTYSSGQTGHEFNCEIAIRPQGLDLTTGLSPLWAQELIGADMARAVLEQVPSQEVHLVPFATFEAVNINTFPAEFLSERLKECRQIINEYYCNRILNPRGINHVSVESQRHGDLTANLVSGPTLFSVSPFGILSLVGDSVASFSSIEDYSAYADESIRNHIRLITLSLGLTSFDEHTITRLINSGATVVQSAGNSRGFPISVPRPDSTIIVGSISPLGFLSHFSQSGPEVTILAPSDYFLFSSYDGNPAPFGGTSGAAPLVTGAVANVMSLLPDIPQDKVRALLRKTAIKTFDSQFLPRDSGVGLVNSYKMVEVARRLKAQGWPQGASRIYDDSNLYNFYRESQEAFERSRFFLESSDPCSIKQGLQLLRKSFLLSPDVDLYRAFLANVYRQHGYPYNAAFYETRINSNFNDLRRLFFLLRQADAPENMMGSLIRGITRFGAVGYAFLNDLVRTEEGRHYFHFITSELHQSHLANERIAH